MAAPRRYPVELKERALQLWRAEQPRRPIAQVARELGIYPEAMRTWIRQDEADRGQRDDRPTSTELEELRRLRKETPSCGAPTRSSRRPVQFSPRSSTRPGDGHDAGRSAA
jgi:transposase